MKKINPSKLVIGFCLLFLFAPLASARQKFASLPGGLLYPQFATAAFTNAAALTSDWYSEIQALYSPGLSDQSPSHAYLIGYGTSNPKVGFNIGYSGSFQSGVAANNLFAGISRRIKNNSIGLSVRKNGLIYSNEMPIDVSWMWNISKSVSMGVVGYDVVKNRTVAMGLGYQSLASDSLELDIQFPLPGYSSLATHEYSVNLASVIFFNNNFGVSLGTRYQRWVVPGSESSIFRHNVGILAKLKGQVSLVGLYSSSPHTVTVGLCWGSPATAQQWIDYWLVRDRQGLNL